MIILSRKFAIPVLRIYDMKIQKQICKFKIHKFRFLIVALLISISSSNALATFAMPQMIPADRLLKNTQAAINENPEDPQLYYNLARIHYLVFVNKAFQVGAVTHGSSPEVAPDYLQGDFLWRARSTYAMELALKEMAYDSVKDVPKELLEKYRGLHSQKVKHLRESGWKPKGPSTPKLIEHADSALKNFNKAIEIDGNNALYQLGLASLLEQYVDFIKEIKVQAMPTQFQNIILEKARDTFYKAYALSITSDMKHKKRPLKGLTNLVGYEAGEGYIRLLKAQSSIDKHEQKSLRKVERDLAKLEKLPWGAITPIIFSLKKSSSMSDLLVRNSDISFDLDGNGAVENWPWVKPDTGLLVWDPDKTGNITSGRQLFGSVSWWLFFENGYRALDALDDDRDGALSGSELNGIAAWFDKNYNGISEPGEVIPVENLGVARISVKIRDYDSGCPMNQNGIKMKDGRTLPTYDWIARKSS